MLCLTKPYLLMPQGDVYHLLHDLGEWVDGRVWPKTDELNVLRLLDLIRHVTGELPLEGHRLPFMQLDVYNCTTA